MAPPPSLVDVATAPARPRPQPERRPSQRPDLRVVDGRERSSLKPRRVGTIAAAVLFVALFALAAFQTVIIKAQAHLDDVNRGVAAEETRQQQLTITLADLQSPDRITGAARDRLGMIPPQSSTFLEPRPDDDEQATFVESPR